MVITGVLTMKSAFPLLVKEMALRVLPSVIFVEVLLFVLPTNGKVEGVAASYWDEVRLRLSSGNYLVIAFLSGIGVAVLMAALLIFSDYLAKFVKPPSGGNQPQGKN